MIVQRFVKWCETAGSRQRAEGFTILARAVLEGRVPKHDAEASRIALHLALDDPSPKVRLAVATAIGADPAAPRTLVKGFLLDIDDIAVRVAGSPVLTEDDLLEALMLARDPLMTALAGRDALSRAAAMSLAGRASAIACEALLRNGTAVVDASVLRRLAARHGDHADLRHGLLARADLPPDVRQTLILEVGRCLQTSPFVTAALGSDGARRIVFDACERATAKMTEWVETRDVPGLVDHLRTSGQISAAFLIRSACVGNIDLLAASLTALSGLSERRVRSIVVDGREGPFRSLLKNCRLADTTSMLLRLAVRNWKEAATGRIPPDVADVPEFVMRRVADAFRRETAGAAVDATTALLNRLEAETARDAMRGRLDRLLAA